MPEIATSTTLKSTPKILLNTKNKQQKSALYTLKAQQHSLEASRYL